MTKERKLFQTLCDGLPHGLKLQTDTSKHGKLIETLQALSISDKTVHTGFGWINFNKIKPILFSSDSLTEEITISGETFNVADRLWFDVIGTDSDSFNKDDFYELLELGQIDFLPRIVIDKLNEWKFNTRNLDPDQFINVKDLEQNPY